MPESSLALSARLASTSHTARMSPYLACPLASPLPMLPTPMQPIPGRSMGESAAKAGWAPGKYPTTAPAVAAAAECLRKLRRVVRDCFIVGSFVERVDD